MSGKPNQIQDGNHDSSFSRYSLQEWAMFAAFPFIKAAGVVPSQPLAKIAAVQQASVATQVAPLTFMQAAGEIRVKSGVLGFFNGTVVSANREAYKSAYKGVLQVFANDFANNTIDQSIPLSSVMRGFITGGIIGVADPLISGPLERYKTWRLANHNRSNVRQFWSEVLKNNRHTSSSVQFKAIIAELYKGLFVTISKQTLMNGAFFTAKQCSDPIVRTYKSEYPIVATTVGALFPAMVAALVGAPLDCIKTVKQSALARDEKTTWKMLKHVVRQGGMRSLFTGLPARTGLITFGYFLNGSFLNMVEQIRGKNPPPPPAESSSKPRCKNQGSRSDSVKTAESDALQETIRKMQSLLISTPQVDVGEKDPDVVQAKEICYRLDNMSISKPGFLVQETVDAQQKNNLTPKF